jgi:hypothetical protein
VVEHHRGAPARLFIELSNIFHDIAVKRYALTLADNYFARRVSRR